MNINEVAQKYEQIVNKCDNELTRERKRTRPNVFYIRAKEHERNNAFKMLKILADMI